MMITPPRLRIIEVTDPEGRTIGGRVDGAGQGMAYIDAPTFAKIMRIAPFDKDAAAFVGACAAAEQMRSRTRNN